MAAAVRENALRSLIVSGLAGGFVIAPALLAPLAMAAGPTLLVIFATACFIAAVIA